MYRRSLSFPISPSPSSGEMEGEKGIAIFRRKPKELEALLSTLFSRRPLSSSSTACIFYRVPAALRKLNEEAYTPQAVSIGPFHYNKPHLQPTKQNKVYYCNCFFDRTGADKERYFKIAKDAEDLWYDQVAEDLRYDQGDIKTRREQFVNMLLMDGIFIIEFFQRMNSSKQVADEHDDIFNKHTLTFDIFIDLILLENQLPFVFLKTLYTSSDNDVKWEEFLFRISMKYFKRGASLEKVRETLKSNDKWHLVDFLHALCIVTVPKVERKDQPDIQLSHYSATELRKAGVKFEVSENKKHPFDLNFAQDKGLLQIPNILVDRWTEQFYRNFIAHEHCLHTDKIISSYIIFIGSLLKTPKDVGLFVKLKIIDNQSLRNSAQLCDLFKNLYPTSMMDRREFHYSSLCESLNEYKGSHRLRWKATLYWWEEKLKHQHIINPWSIFSAVVGFMLLVLIIYQIGGYFVMGEGWCNLYSNSAICLVRTAFV